MKKVGFTIGKFAPLHKGHQYLIETALKEVDEFYIVIYETNLIENPIEQRAEWIHKIYPSVKILYARNPPLQYGLDEESVKKQIDYLKYITKDISFTHFYSSEKYGYFVARDFNVKNRIVDSNRVNVNISGTRIRNDINKYSTFLDDIVLEDLKK